MSYMKLVYDIMESGDYEAFAEAVAEARSEQKTEVHFEQMAFDVDLAGHILNYMNSKQQEHERERNLSSFDGPSIDSLRV